jgi:hypothetical protein
MLILNFAHPITPVQQACIAELTGQLVERVIDVPTQFDPAQPFVEQAHKLIDSAGLTSQEWQTVPLLINLPSLNVIAALVLAELHGRCGYFPAVLRLRPIAGSTPPQFEVAELLNLQSIREQARLTR